MSTPGRLPLALKVFAWSLLMGVVCGYGAFRLAFYIALRLLEGEYAEALALLIAVVAALAVGVSGAITAGVLAGRATGDKGVKL